MSQDALDLLGQAQVTRPRDGAGFAARIDTGSEQRHAYQQCDSRIGPMPAKRGYAALAIPMGEAQYQAQQQLVGTVRVITSCNNTELLPLEQHFAGLITEHSLAPQRFARQHICEISRLAVPAEVRRQHHRGNACSTTEQQCYRQVAVALYLIATQLCLQTNRYHSFVMIEPALARILRRIGIQFVQIGEPINYNGLRAPYYLDMRTTNVTLATEYQHLRARLAQQLNATPELQFIA